MADLTPYFEEARKELLGKYRVNESEHRTLMGNLPDVLSTRHELEFHHNKYAVLIEFELGHQNLARAFCQLPIRPDYFFFSIWSNSPWKQLLFRKKPLEIECENPSVVEKIRESDEFKTLSEIAEKTKFEPQFSGNNRAHGFEIRCTFHLKFDDQGVVILPLCLFYMKLINIFSHEQK